MANLSKQKRDQMIAYLEKLKEDHIDDESIAMFNEIENSLTEKRYGLVFEEHSEEVVEKLEDNIPVLTSDPERRLCKDENLPWNFIIEGDNLQALYLLEKTHRGKIDCIYIDPPYNSGAKDWKYNNDYVDSNDIYRHSKWLSMIKTRIMIAKRLLNPDDSVLIVTIDEKEYLHLGCLLEELFPDAKIQMISSVINHGSVARNNEFNRNNEYIFFVMIGNFQIQALEESKNFQTGDGVQWRTLRRTNAGNLRSKTKTQFYPIYVDVNSKTIKEVGMPMPLSMQLDEVEQIDGCVPVFPIRDNGTEMMWGLTREELISRMSKGYVRVTNYNPNKHQVCNIEYLPSGTIEGIESGIIETRGYNPDGSIIAVFKKGKAILPKTQWDNVLHDARDQGTRVLKLIFGVSPFSFPKSVYAVHDCIKYFISHKEDAIVLDFFAGSGTTQHAVNLLNEADGGHRKCIMVTNNEISVEEEKNFEKLGIKKGDEEWENLGIARHVTWPRTVCSINGCNIKGEPIKESYAINYPDGTPLTYEKGFKCNVKYMRCEWIPKHPQDEMVSDLLMQHIAEMIELENGIEVDGKHYLLITSEDEADDIANNWNNYPQLLGIFISRNVLLTTKQNALFKTIEMHTIPDYYFDYELKEVGETW